jgi:hypothetical protein
MTRIVISYHSPYILMILELLSIDSSLCSHYPEIKTFGEQYNPEFKIV